MMQTLSFAVSILLLSIATSVRAENTDPCGFRAPNHVPQPYLLRHVEDVSRDYYYIHLKESPDKLEICGFVGGEHMTFYRILGFTNEHFHIETESYNGEAYMSVSGEGVTVVTDDTGKGHDALIESGETAWIEISVSASFNSFSSGYRIVVAKD